MLVLVDDLPIEMIIFYINGLKIHIGLPIFVYIFLYVSVK